MANEMIALATEARDFAAHCSAFPEKLSPRMIEMMGKIFKVSQAYLAEHREDDGELVTPDFMWEIGIGDSAFAKDSKRFELCPGVRVMFFACQGPKCWNAEVWVGDATRKILNPTRGQVRRLASALGIELKGGV